MKTRFEAQFKEVFKKVVGTKDFDESWAMNSIAEWDSLKHVQLIAELEDALNIQFDYEDIVTMTSIAKIDAILCKFQ
jgi:acyl carrier protein